MGDMWSAGATIFELCTGRLLFACDDNHGLMLEMFKVCGSGPFPKSMTSSGCFASQFFDSRGDLRMTDGSKLARAEFTVPTEPIREELEALLGAKAASQIPRVAGLITECLTPVPTKRLTPEQALKNKFISG